MPSGRGRPPFSVLSPISFLLRSRLEAFWRVSCVGHIFYRPRCKKGVKVPSRASGAILCREHACRIAVEGSRSLSGSVLRFGRLMYRPEGEMALRGSTVAI